MKAFRQFGVWIECDASKNAGLALRLALIGSVSFAVAHYWFGEWVFHPRVPLWREKVFWSEMPWAAIIPLLNWLTWVIISLGRVNPARLIFLSYAVLYVGDWLWLLIWRKASLLGLSLSPTFWDWWTHWLIVILAIGNLLIAQQWIGISAHRICRHSKKKLTLFEIGLRAAAILLGLWAIVLTVIHLVIPRLPINEFTLDVGRKFLIRQEPEEDYEFILQNVQCRGTRLSAVLQHVKLAHLQRNHFYKDLDPTTFQQFILSPIVDTLPLPELDWRPMLWEYFYPRIRRENDVISAAEITVLFLRERVGISSVYPFCVGVETIWKQGMTDAAGFERIYVAALRSVGIASRLNDNMQAELLLTDGKWQLAPRPLITTL